MNKMDLPCFTASATPSGPRTPWLIALLRKSTLAGSISSEASGSRSWETSQETPLPAILVNASPTGPMPSAPRIAMPAPTMPAVKLSTSISNPARVRSWMKPSTSLMTKAASGPTIIAPRNIGTSVPTTTPMVATAPTTAPRWACTMRPPV